MPDRTINFGESETEATYQIQDTDAVDGGGNFVVARDTNANTVLLQYDPAADTWEYAGDVDMNGGNVSGVGTLTADSVNTESAQIGWVSGETAYKTAAQTYSDTLTISEITWDATKNDPDNHWDLTNNKFVIPDDGDYSVTTFARFSSLGTGRVNLIVQLNGSDEVTDTRKFNSQPHNWATWQAVCDMPNLTAGDEVTVVLFADNTLDIDASEFATFCSISKQG